MRRERASGGWLAAGAALSVLVHAGGGLLLVAWVTDEGAAAPRAPSAEMAPDDERDDLRLGQQRASAVSINWLGFDTPTEHEAEVVSETEQPALSMAPVGNPSPDPAVGVPGDGASVRAPIAPGERAAAPGGIVGPALPTESSTSVATGDAREAQMVASPGAGSVAVPPATADVPIPGESGGGGGQSASGAPSGGDDQPGLPSDRESIATAIREAVDLAEWGKPLAREGLEIKTVRPRWSVSARVMRWPGNPIVFIRFGADGSVKFADFLREGRRVYSTGFPDVDGPLLDAVYRWKAEGKAIEALEGEETTEVSIRVVLRG